MKQFFYLYIVFLLFQNSQTEFIGDDDDDLDPLTIDQAYLNISNHYSHPIRVTQNLVVCERCDFGSIGDPIDKNAMRRIIVDTKYAHDFKIFNDSFNNEFLLCEIKAYTFSETGIYLLEIKYDQQHNHCSCTIDIKHNPNELDYWLPLIIGLALMLLFVLLTQIWYRLTRSKNFVHILPHAVQRGIIKNDFTVSLPRPTNLIANDPTDDILTTLGNDNDIVLSNRIVTAPTVIPIPKSGLKRLRSLDTFRGISLAIMIFVNYGGGGYWFFHHSIWNGLTVADIVFPWFTWMMGISIVLSQRSLRAKNVRKVVIFGKICRRTCILFALGLILQGGWDRWVNIRIFGVLQRLALCYFFAALIVLIFDDKEDEPYKVHLPTDDDVHQPLRQELKHTIFHFWPEWLFILFITVVWILITFVPKLDGCPRGYIGPGGKHDHGAFENCTGGVAGYIDRKVLGSSHILSGPTCKKIYDTNVPFDPEGILGILTGTLLCYLGVHAGHSFAHSTSIHRVCSHWVISGIICGGIGLILSKGGQSDSWIPINKNLWSLSFVLILASLAFIILTILYLFVDVYEWYTGAPFIWLGMNSIIIYVGHESCSRAFPVQFQVEETTHAQLSTMHLYGVLFWTIVAGLMYRKKFFVAV